MYRYNLLCQKIRSKEWLVAIGASEMWWVCKTIPYVRFTYKVPLSRSTMKCYDGSHLPIGKEALIIA